MKRGVRFSPFSETKGESLTLNLQISLTILCINKTVFSKFSPSLFFHRCDKVIFQELIDSKTAISTLSFPSTHFPKHLFDL